MGVYSSVITRFHSLIAQDIRNIFCIPYEIEASLYSLNDPILTKPDTFCVLLTRKLQSIELDAYAYSNNKTLENISTKPQTFVNCACHAILKSMGTGACE